MSVATAFSKSLRLPLNPELRDHLTEIAIAGKATPEQLAAIPIFAGELSVDEQRAIEKTLAHIGQDPSPALSQYLHCGAEARRNFIDALNVQGADNHRATKIGAIAGGVAGLIGLVVGLVTGNADVAVGAPFAGTFAATLSTVYGFSRAGTIDAEIAAYGRYQ